MPMAELLKELDRVRASFDANPPKAWSKQKGLTDDWQARQLLAEIGSRQLTLL
jgi:hypothetical protein